MEKIKKKKKTAALQSFKDEFGAWIVGFKDMNDLVESVWCSHERDLLSGRLVFAIQPSKNLGTTLDRLIIVKNPWLSEEDEKGKKTYTVSYKCSGHTAYIPCAIYKYISEFLPDYMKDWGFKDDIIEEYKQTIQKFKYE